MVKKNISVEKVINKIHDKSKEKKMKIRKDIEKVKEKEKCP